MDLDYHRPEDFATDDSFVNYCFHSNGEDQLFWEQWLHDHPDKKEVVRKAQELVFLMSIKIPGEEKQQEWGKVNLNKKANALSAHKKTPSEHVPKRRWLIAGIAFLLIVIAGSTYWFTEAKLSKSKEGASLPASEYATVPGQRQNMVLSDGTHVWLNADSKLTCTSDFHHSTIREVTLSGEAYFEVSHDPSKPFIIHANNMNITVLGTAFNVKAYPDDKTMETTLINGSIEITLANDPSRKIRLKPHEKITVLNENFKLTPISTVKKVTASKDTLAEFAVSHVHKDPLLDSSTVETAWMNGVLAFRSERFDELAKQMERRYNVHFHFADEAIKAYRFTGIFSTETVSQALHALQLTSPSAPFNYNIQGQDVYVKKK